MIGLVVTEADPDPNTNSNPNPNRTPSPNPSPDPDHDPHQAPPQQLNPNGPIASGTEAKTRSRTWQGWLLGRKTAPQACAARRPALVLALALALALALTLTLTLTRTLALILAQTLTLTGGAGRRRDGVGGVAHATVPQQRHLCWACRGRACRRGWSPWLPVNIRVKSMLGHVRSC